MTQSDKGEPKVPDRPPIEKRVSNAGPSISTWELLPDLGFKPDPNVISDVIPGLSCDFGNFKLSASNVLGKHFHKVVLFTGVVVGDRTISEVCFELPLEVESQEQAKAFIVYYLDKAADGRCFKPRFPCRWLVEGRQQSGLLPWEKHMAAYAIRPQCSVANEWARVALKSLAVALARAADGDKAQFSFDGEVLKIRCDNKVVVMPAIGERWTHSYSISASMLRRLPVRLKIPETHFSIWNGALYIDNRKYDGVSADE